MIDKKSVKYQNSPKGSDCCGHCTMWRPPANCSYVEGVISPKGWCKAFKQKVNEDAPTMSMGTSSSSAGSGPIVMFDPLLGDKKKKMLKRFKDVIKNGTKKK